MKPCMLPKTKGAVKTGKRAYSQPSWNDHKRRTQHLPEPYGSVHTFSSMNISAGHKGRPEGM